MKRPQKILSMVLCFMMIMLSVVHYPMQTRGEDAIDDVSAELVFSTENNVNVTTETKEVVTTETKEIITNESEEKTTTESIGEISTENSEYNKIDSEPKDTSKIDLSQDVSNSEELKAEAVTEEMTTENSDKVRIKTPFLGLLRSYDVASLVNNAELSIGDIPVTNGTGISFNDTIIVRYYLDTLYPADIDGNIQNFETDITYNLPDIPKELSTLDGQPLNFEVMMRDRNKLGKAVFTPGINGSSGSIKITFDKGLTNLDDIKDAWIEFSAKLNKNECGSEQEKDITFNLASGAATYHILLTDNIPTEPELVKSGTYDNIANIINWEVKITEGSKNYTGNMLLDDTFGDNQEYVPGSFIVTEPGKISTNATPALIGNKLTYYFLPKKVNGDEWKFCYKTRLKGNAIVKDDKLTNGDISIKAGNKADLYDAANKLICTHTAEVTCTKNYQWLSKDGKVLKDGNGVPNGNIEWTLTVNPNGYTFENVVVYDKVLGVPVNPSESQIYFKNNLAFSGSGNHDKNIVTYADTVEYIATKTAADSDRQNYSMKVDLGKISGKDNIVITYTTEIRNYNDYIKYNQPSITNQAWMRFDWPDYNGPGVSKKIGVPVLEQKKDAAYSAISKSDGIYNKSTHEISWDITVNSNKAALLDVVIKDIPGAQGNENVIDGSQDYVSYSNLKIDGSLASISNFENKYADGTVDFNFGNELNGKKAVFTVTTKLKNADYYENNNNTDTFYNKVELYSNSVKLSSDDGKVKPAIKVLDKLDPVYNYDSQVMSWKIKVNEDNMALSDPVITDVIPSGLVLDKNSIKFSDGTIIPSGISGSPKPYYSYITEGNKQTLKIYLTDFGVGDSAKEIYFDTVVDADTAVFDGKAMKSYNGDLTVSNTAILNKSSSTSTVSDSGSIKIKNNMLNKKGTVSRNDGLWITYEVIINQTKSELLENTFIMDILSPGMSFSLPSLELYTAKVNADGTVSKQNKVTDLNYETLILGTDNGYSKDMGSMLLKIKLPENSQKQTYVLSYRVAVTDDTKNDYINDITMTGLDSNSTGTSVKMSHADVVGGGGGSSSTSSRVELTKYDIDNKTQVLAGAVFTLSYDGHVIDEKKTNNKGIALFSGLVPGESYTITETGAPVGYRLKIMSAENKTSGSKLTLSGNSFQITAPPTGNANRLQLTVGNEKYKGNISFTKVGRTNEVCAQPLAGGVDPDKGLPLMGVEFTLYSAEDKTTPIETKASDQNGKVVFENLNVGQYIIQETKGVSGYIKNDTLYYAQVEENGFDGLRYENGSFVKNNQVMNEVLLANIRMKKVNEKITSEPVSGSTYGLYRYTMNTSVKNASRTFKNLMFKNDGLYLKGADLSSQNMKLIATAITNQEGMLEFKGVLMDTSYIIMEMEAPDGSYVSAYPITIRFTMDSSGKSRVSQFDDGQGTAEMNPVTGEIMWKEPPVEVEFCKTDTSGTLLGGAKLEVRDSDGKTVESWTTEQGKTHVSSGIIIAGKPYTLVETEAPSGYKEAAAVDFLVPNVKVGPGENRVIKVTMVDEKKVTPIPKKPDVEIKNDVNNTGFIYIDTLNKLNTADSSNSNDSGSSEDYSGKTDKSAVNAVTAVKTGDTGIAAWLWILLAAAVSLVLTVIMKRRRN